MKAELTSEMFQQIPAHLQLQLAIAARAEYQRQVRDEGLKLDPKMLRTVNEGIARLRAQLGIH